MAMRFGDEVGAALAPAPPPALTGRAGRRGEAGGLQQARGRGEVGGAGWTRAADGAEVAAAGGGEDE